MKKIAVLIMILGGFMAVGAIGTSDYETAAVLSGEMAASAITPLSRLLAQVAAGLGSIVVGYILYLAMGDLERSREASLRALCARARVPRLQGGDMVKYPFARSERIGRLQNVRGNRAVIIPSGKPWTKRYRKLNKIELA